LPDIGPLKTRFRFDVPPLSGKLARPTIMRASGQNRFYPSGESMIFNNLLFFDVFVVFGAVIRGI
jgi:hypothetical protein